MDPLVAEQTKPVKLSDKLIVYFHSCFFNVTFYYLYLKLLLTVYSYTPAGIKTAELLTKMYFKFTTFLSYEAQIPCLRVVAVTNRTFIINRLSFLYLSLTVILLFCPLATALSTKHKFIMFFLSVGNPKTVLKSGYFAGEAEALLQAFGLSLGSCGLSNVLTTVYWLFSVNNPIPRDLLVIYLVLL